MPEENNSRVSVLEFDRDQVLNRYWELGQTGPRKVTKGNITGQLKALDALREELAGEAEGYCETTAFAEDFTGQNGWTNR